MGNGMIMANCHVCDDEGNVLPANKGYIVPTIDEIDRKADSYKKAIKDIMDINPGIKRKDAVKMFDDAYEKG